MPAVRPSPPSSTPSFKGITELSEAILGLSAFYHDSAAALLVDGQIVAAAQEERFTRKKHDPAFPAKALAYVMAESGLRLSDLTAVAFYDKPYLKFERLLETYHGFAPRGLQSFLMAMPVWIKEKLMMRTMLREELAKVGDGDPPLLFPEHHLSHAASAFYPSPFEEAAILTVDGVGEWATSTIGFGRGNETHHPAGAAVSPLPGPALFGLHLLLRLQGQQRRIQAHGAGPLRQPRRRAGQTLASP